MKILQLTNKIPYPPKDGGAIATLNISLGLHSLGHEITLLGMNTSKHYTNLDELPDTLKDNIDIRDVKVDTEICHRAMLKNLFFSRLPYNAVRFFNEDFAQSLTKLLQEKEFDVIQLEGLYMSWYIKTIREHSKALISLRAHNIEHEIWERTAAQERSLFKRFYFRELSRRIKRFKMSIMNSYDLLLPITKRDASKYFELGNTRPAFVVPAGYDVSHLNTQSNTVSFPMFFLSEHSIGFLTRKGLCGSWKRYGIILLQQTQASDFMLPDVMLLYGSKNYFYQKRELFITGRLMMPILL